MKLLKKKNYSRTIRKVTDDDKTKVLAVVGTIGDLLAEGILESCTQYSFDTWMCVPVSGYDKCAGFGATRDEAIQNAVFSK